MTPKPFDQLPALMRLSSENIYRLMHISGSANQWSEETLTEILRGHLTGDQYRIDARCPTQGPHKCAWNKSSVHDVVGGIRLTNKTTEEPICGADMLLTLADGAPDPDADSNTHYNFYIQAKRVRGLDQWVSKDSRFTPSSEQTRTLAAAAAKVGKGTAAYYLLYVQGVDPHDSVPGRCDVHQSPQDCAAMLVTHAATVEYLKSPDRRDPRKLLERGTPLRCLAASCQDRSEDASPAQRAADLSRAYGENVTASTPRSTRGHSIEQDGMHALTIYPSTFVRTDTDETVEGQVLVVILGKWNPNGNGDRNGIGEHRRGSGWYPDLSEIDLVEASRQWWRMASHRATSVRYLVAVANGKVRACYSVKGATEVEGGRYSFDVDEVPPLVEGRLRDATAALLKKRKPGARNPVTFTQI